MGAPKKDEEEHLAQHKSIGLIGLLFVAYFWVSGQHMHCNLLPSPSQAASTGLKASWTWGRRLWFS
jgi:hypothetical protein